MRKIAFLSAAFACLSLFAVSEASDVASHTTELLSMQRKRFEAMVKADIPTLKLIISGDLTYTHTNCETDSKDSFLSKIESNTFTYKAIQTTSTTVRIYGDAGVITGRGKIELLFHGMPMLLEISFIEVQVKSEGRWQLLVWQSTRLR